MLRPRYFAMVMSVCVLAPFLFTGTALARDRSFAAVLDGLKKEYHAEPQKIPGLWLAKCVIKVVPKHGVSKLDFVIFEEEHFRELATVRDLDTRIQGMLGSGWSPFVQVDSSEDKDRVLIFARPHGRHMDLFILTCDRQDGVAMFLRVKPKVMEDMLDNPGSLPNNI